MKKVVSERKDIVFFIKMTPLPIHKGAYAKAKAIVCAKSLALLEDAFAKKAIPKPKCKTSAVDENIALMKKLSIPALPAIVLPDGRVVVGGRDAKGLEDMVKK